MPAQSALFMISVRQAIDLILNHQKDFGTEKVELLHATSRVLSRQVLADRDFPPFDRVMMDGIAIRQQSYLSGTRSFPVESVQAAGAPPYTLVGAENCIEVMTGSVLPANTDAIVPYEQCTIMNGIATVQSHEVTKLQHVHRQGVDMKAGEMLVEKCQIITPAITGILASVGIGEAEVLQMPKIAVCSTGDELVEISHQPATHQVRRSNAYMLAAALHREHITPEMHHLPDEPGQMAAALNKMLHNDVILLSGAVSKGKFDYLPGVLSQLGMTLIFHSVAQRPGKPLLFGAFANGTLVFGFPGNPVSTFVCYQQFFRPWLRASLRMSPPQLSARLAEDVTFKPLLTYHLLVRLAYVDGGIFATPIHSSTSGDLVALAHADGILKLPPDSDHFSKGEAFELTLL